MIQLPEPVAAYVFLLLVTFTLAVLGLLFTGWIGRQVERLFPWLREGAR